MQKLGKKKILGLLTAAAIVATTVGSFAVWDTLTATTSNKLTLANPITTTAALADFAETNSGDYPVYEGAATFNVANVDTTKLTTGKITLSTQIKDGASDVSSDFDVTYEKKDGTAIAGGVATGITNGDNEYNVKVTPKDSAKTNNLGGKELTVEITGELSAVK
ncbi:hypothetical protein [[Clostridium] hylemonae]|uniref:hypothetical protein n=1 Tax=[Clostridium] hylemonae TaxID=89153 RepID=UPI001FCAB39A|nr:hypothetical protein [[Clostridium] hylemonae]BDF05129.1 hypothetical protein CE91St63_21910 [[Clostridium] hylemonae]